jgi:tetratricopeptide (TPR) repeat protein
MAVADAAEGAGDASTLVAAALGAGGLWVHEQRDVIARASVHALWQRARAVAPADSLARARLVVREAAEAVYDGAPLEPVVAAVDHVRAFEDERATAEAMSLFHNVQLGPRYGEERLRLAEEIIRRSARADDSLLALMGLCWRTVDLFLLGYPRAVQSLTELRERCTVVGCEAIGFIADVLDAMLLARAGRLDDAEKATTAALERGLAAGDPDAPAYYGAMLAALRWWQGRGGEVIDFVQALAISPRLGLNDHVYVAASALLSASEGEEDAAEEWLARLGSIGLSNLPDSSSWLTTQLLVIEAAYVLGDAMTAKEAGELLRPYTSLPVMPSLAVVCLGSAERGLGLAAATMGEFDQAVEHLSAALRADRTLGSRPMGALTEHTLAAVLRARGVSGDDARAERLASRADEQARRMGMELPQHPGWLPTEAQARPNPRTRHASLERVFNGWSVGVDGRSTILPDRVGLAYLAELLAHPGQELDAMAIASHVSIDPPASAEPILDDSALSAYRRRVRELTLLLERTDLSSIQVKQHRRELAALTATLRSATGMHGRSRAFPGNHERARTAVRKAIVRALASIHIADPELGEHLRRNVVTGASCRYLPDSGWSINRAENERNRDVANDSPVFEGSENSRAPVGRDSR